MKQTVSVALALMLTFSAFAKDNKAATSAHVTLKNANVSVNYGQQAKSAKQTFATKPNEDAVIGYGKVWRPGDDKATEITFSKDCLFAGHPVKAGTYTLLIKPLNTEWMLILNSKLGQKGTFNYDKVKADDAVLAAIGAKKTDKVVDKFTITLQDDGILMEWDNMSGFASIK